MVIHSYRPVTYVNLFTWDSTWLISLVSLSKREGGRVLNRICDQIWQNPACWTACAIIYTRPVRAAASAWRPLLGRVNLNIMQKATDLTNYPSQVPSFRVLCQKKSIAVLFSSLNIARSFCSIEKARPDSVIAYLWYAEPHCACVATYFDRNFSSSRVRAWSPKRCYISQMEHAIGLKLGARLVLRSCYRYMERSRFSRK